jgi:hypothetical protein
MRKLTSRTGIGFGALVLSLLLWTAGTASANPIPPGPFLENETHTWIDFSQGQPSVTMFMFHSDQYELTDEFDFPQLVVETTDGGFLVDIRIPNFVDPLDTKKILITFVGANPEPIELPDVLGIEAWDTPFGTGGDPIQVSGSFHKSNSLSTGDGFEHSQWWVIHPNPDWETVRVVIPRTFGILSLHIDTYSIDLNVPEPSSLALVVVGSLGLLVAGRRRIA